MQPDEILFQKICSAVRAAGALIEPAKSSLDIHAKEGSSNFVTKYDSLVQNYLVEHLSALLPEAAFVGEEDGYSDHRVGEGYTFLVDPIDGTTNFICSFPVSAVCVGLAFQGKMIMGAVYNPFRGEFFAAQKGKGAFLNGNPLSVSCRPLKEGVLCMDTAPYNEELREQAFETVKKLSYHCMDIRSIGSAALSICYIACGRCAAYISPKLSVWDYAAASLILGEAGGLITGKEGRDLDFSSGVAVLAGTPQTLPELLSEVI